MDEAKQYLDIKQTFFVWYRPDGGYYWDDEASLDEFWLKSTEAELKLPYLIETPETTSFKPSKIMEIEPALFTKFAALNEAENKADAIIAFANAYGSLTLGEHQLHTPRYSHKTGEAPPWKHGVGAGLVDESVGLKYANVGGDSLSLWQDEIRYMASTVLVWERLQREDIESLKKVIYWHGEKGVKYVLGEEEMLDMYADLLKAGKAMPLQLSLQLDFGWLASVDHNHNAEIFNSFRAGDVLLPAKYLIQSRINDKLKDHLVKPRLLMNDQNELTPYLYPDNLLAAMWLQFFQAVTGERMFKRCAVCGLWAEMTGRNPKNRNWTRHPECANRDRVRRAREKKAAK